MEYHAASPSGEAPSDDALDTLSEEDIEAMVADVWATLDLAGSPAPLDPAVEQAISASADLQGDAENLDAALQLVVTVDHGAAGILAATFFGPDTPAGRAELADAVGELANMCAGAVKTLLEGEWVIGIPTPADENTTRGPRWRSATVAVDQGWVRLAVGPGAADVGV